MNDGRTIDAFCPNCGSPISWADAEALDESLLDTSHFREGQCTFVDCKKKWTFMLECVSGQKHLMIIQTSSESILFEPYPLSVVNYLDRMPNEREEQISIRGY